MKIKFILIFFVLGILTGCLPDSDKKSDVEAFKVIIADRTFKIPKGYFDGRKPTGKDTESVVLEYELPGFDVLPRERDARQKLIDEGRMTSTLLEASRNRPSLDIMVRNSFKYAEDLPKPFYKEQTTIVYGLQKYEAQKPHSKLYLKDDLFVERAEDGSVISFLRCSPPGKVKHPSCKHKFRDKGLLYSIRWPIEYLPRWQEQRESEITFIDSLEFKKNK